MERRFTVNACAVLCTGALLASSCELYEDSPPTGPVAPDPVHDAPGQEQNESPAASEQNEEPMDDEGATFEEQPPSTPQAPEAPEAPEAAGDDEASDQAITEEVRQAIASDDWLSDEARQIEVTTQDGVVTLRGRVESEDERAVVLDIARNTHGVRDVVDELEVVGDAAPQEN